MEVFIACPGTCPVSSGKFVNYSKPPEDFHKMKEKSLLLNFTGDLPLFRIVDFLLENKGMDFSKTEIANGASLSRASVFNYWSKVEKYGLVRVTRRFGKTKLYTLNSSSVVVKKIVELEQTLISEAMDKAAGSRRKPLAVSNI